jgi:hypothetical protein
MGKKELAILIDAYADAKASTNKHLANMMIKQLEMALEEIFGSGAEQEPETEPAEVTLTQEY